jgi:GAF domain-containing protein
LNRELQVREAEIQAGSLALEKQVELRTTELNEVNRELGVRADRLEAIAEISQTVATIQDTAAALSALPELISRRLGYYHVGVFLTEEDGQYVALRAANSEGGQRMLAAGHRLRVGVTGLVGYAARSGTARVALDVGADPAFFDNPNLPRTRSEIALPLRVGERTIGVLDVQSSDAAAFGAEDIEILGLLANQAAVAIENSRLLAEARAALQARSDIGARELARIAALGEVAGYEYMPERGVTRTAALPTEAPDSAAASRTGAAVEFPVRIRGQVAGILRAEALAPGRQWTAYEVGLLQAVADRAAIALENAGFLSESQRRAAKERTIGEISARIGASSRFESILQTATRELSRALGGSQVSVHIDPSGQSWSTKEGQP